jgi:nucleotide-binding universal stress UspA family protein
MTGNTERGGGRIVVGVDGTAASLIAVRWAVQEALLRQASVHLIHVSRQYQRASYSGSPQAPPAGENGPDPSAQLAAADLEAGRALPPDRLSSELVSGSPARVLIDRSAGAELLVLGTAYPPGHSAAEMPPMVGSTMRACLHGAACPVVVVSTSRGLARARPAPGKSPADEGNRPER